MRALASVALLAAFLPVAANSAPTPPVLGPAEAIQSAQDHQLTGKPGRFGFTVARAEMVGPRLFLNSSTDYRSAANLAVAIEQPAFAALRARYGQDLAKAFLNRSIVVDGVPRRQAIAITEGARNSLRGSYFQTHIQVRSANQISVTP